VASDLRFIIAAMKMNTDLERVGDLAVNIARKAANLAAQPPVPMPFDLEGMWRKTQRMLRDSLEALVNLDGRLAHNVCARDSEVDQMKKDIRRTAEELIRRDSSQAPALLNLLAISRNLERIADHATNIAEDVIYMVEGRISRHVAPD
jgi:phosphate transport system protein